MVFRMKCTILAVNSPDVDMGIGRPLTGPSAAGSLAVPQPRPPITSLSNVLDDVDLVVDKPQCQAIPLLEELASATRLVPHPVLVLSHIT